MTGLPSSRAAAARPGGANDLQVRRSAAALVSVVEERLDELLTAHDQKGPLTATTAGSGEFGHSPEATTPYQPWLLGRNSTARLSADPNRMSPFRFHEVGDTEVDARFSRSKRPLFQPRKKNVDDLHAP